MFLLLLQFVWYVLVMVGAVIAVLIMPGWWWAVMAASIAAVIALSIASGLGSRRAGQLLGWMFWTDERFIRRLPSPRLTTSSRPLAPRPPPPAAIRAAASEKSRA